MAHTAICEMREVRMIARTCPVRRDPMAATMSTAARVGMTTAPTRPEKASRMIAIQMPEKMAAQRLRAPAATLSAVWPTEPPTGCPRKRPDSTLPTPWARKSRFGSALDPSGFGADSLTPAPWIRTSARDRECARDKVDGELAQLWKRWHWQALGDLAHVSDALDSVRSQGDHRRGGDCQCDE